MHFFHFSSMPNPSIFPNSNSIFSISLTHKSKQQTGDNCYNHEDYVPGMVLRKGGQPQEDEDHGLRTRKSRTYPRPVL